LELHKSLEPADKDSKDYILWLIEGDQALTGGGFDNNQIGEVHKALLNFIIKAQNPLEYRDSDLSRIVVEGAIKLREQFVHEGIRLGSLEPDGASKVRFDQDKDGMMGFPVYGNANRPLTKEVALRLLLLTGVDTRPNIGRVVKDKHSGLTFEYRNIDALAHILDNSVFGVNDLNAIVTPLARIQKHGYILEEGKLKSKPGKTRGVSAVSAIEGLLEAMIMAPFLRECQSKKISVFPSLQDKPTRVSMITKMLKDLFLQEYDMLAADLSQYDATVNGSIFATILLIAIKPFYNARYHEWFDRAVHIMTFKHYLLDKSLTSLWPDLEVEAKQLADYYYDIDKAFHLFSVHGGLPSGVKFTHIGGSVYGLVTVHYVIPTLIGYEPIFGPQAGDDVLLPIPKSLILEDVKSTYKPLSEHAATLGMEINESKQIWHKVKGEVIKVFLQESYHHNTDTWGTGSIFRPAAAAFFAERNKGLSIAEQMLAQISRANQGDDNPFAEDVMVFWMNRETFLGALFKEYGVSAFQVLVDSIGDGIDAIAERIDVGSFSWGISEQELRDGNLGILPVMANASTKVKVDVPLSQILKTLEVEERVDEGSPDPDFVDEDILDD